MTKPTGRATPSRKDLYQEIVRLRAEGRPAALATIISRVGSVPRKDTAKMLIAADGTSVGSVGGGRVEAMVLETAQKVIQTRCAQLVEYQLNAEDAEGEGLICGGTVQIFVEPVLPDPKLALLGAGHLGKAIADIAAGVGFRVAVVDDRPSFAAPERFPGAEIFCQSFEASLEPLGVNAESYILIITRGHRQDHIALERALQTPARYIGLVGSRRKIAILVTSLLEKGYSKETFQRLYAPIGLDIGSDTPEEIAVAVVAELIAVKKGAHTRSDKQQHVMKIIEEWRGGDDAPKNKARNKRTTKKSKT
jgi:xanthine dehydrogenase accessory factor